MNAVSECRTLEEQLSALQTAVVNCGGVLPNDDYWVRGGVLLGHKVRYIHAGARYRDGAYLKAHGYTGESHLALACTDNKYYLLVAPSSSDLPGVFSSGLLDFKHTSPRNRRFTLTLHDKDGTPTSFNATLNIKPLGNLHFVVWPNPELINGEWRVRKQVYCKDALFFMNSLADKTPDCFCFYNPWGSHGDPVFHLQSLREKAPVFTALRKKIGNSIEVKKGADWLFAGHLVRFHHGSSEARGLIEGLHQKAATAIRGNHIINIICKQIDGLCEMLLVDRGPGPRKPAWVNGVEMDIAGYEVAGNILLPPQVDREASIICKLPD
jgi:hypothetical protein